MNINYNNIMKKTIDQLNGKVYNLLLHSCCAPCSTEVIARLTKYFNITVFYYNPNIEPKEEYFKRKKEQIRFIEEYSAINKLYFLDCDYDNNEYEKSVKGFEHEKEGGKRCHICYGLRLEKTAIVGKEKAFDYFTTTLTVSPYKDSNLINKIGKELENKYNIKYLNSDFKKEDGYKKSIEYSKEYNLYRQDYCGCQYSKNKDIKE